MSHSILTQWVINWQAKELNRVILECAPQKAGVDLDLLEHISPIGWENIVLYGEYVLNRNLIKGLVASPLSSCHYRTKIL